MTRALFATRLRLPRFTLDIRRALRTADLDLFRVPPLSGDPTEATLELEAADSVDAATRIRAALAPEYVSLMPGDFVVQPTPVAGTRWGDGPPSSA